MSAVLLACCLSDMTIDRSLALPDAAEPPAVCTVHIGDPVLMEMGQTDHKTLGHLLTHDCVNRPAEQCFRQHPYGM